MNRDVVRLWSLLAVRSLARDDINGAIGYVRRSLRLSRDVRPRGPAIAQLAGAALDAVTCNLLLPQILAHPRLSVGQCDQIVNLLAEHASKLGDWYATGVKSEYVMLRGIIRTFEDRVATTIDASGRAVQKRLDEEGRWRVPPETDLRRNRPAERINLE